MGFGHERFLIGKGNKVLVRFQSYPIQFKVYTMNKKENVTEDTYWLIADLLNTPDGWMERVGTCNRNGGDMPSYIMEQWSKKD